MCALQKPMPEGELTGEQSVPQCSQQESATFPDQETQLLTEVLFKNLVSK